MEISPKQTKQLAILMNSPKLLARRAELLAELFLQQFDPLFLAKSDSAHMPFDLIAGFETSSGALKVFAVEVKVKPSVMRERFPLIGTQEKLRHYAAANIPVLLLIVDTKGNDIFYAWGNSIDLKKASYLERRGRIMVPVIKADENGLIDLRNAFYSDSNRYA